MFNPQRIPFCVIGNRITYAEGESRHQPCRDWIAKELHLNGDEMVRGYFLCGTVRFYTGADYRIAIGVGPELVSDAKAAHFKIYGSSDCTITNGCILGEVDTQWPPILKWNGSRWTQV